MKGIITVEDALLAAECGVDGIVLTNHGGRQLDGAISAMEILPDVAAAVGDRLTVLIDGGFRRGSDIVKARLLGAHAAMLGRATLYGLAAGGEAGAGHAIDILKTEVDRVLGLLGFSDINAMDPRCLRWPARTQRLAAEAQLQRSGDLNGSGRAADVTPSLEPMLPPYVSNQEMSS